MSGSEDPEHLEGDDEDQATDDHGGDGAEGVAHDPQSAAAQPDADGPPGLKKSTDDPITTRTRQIVGHHVGSMGIESRSGGLRAAIRLRIDHIALREHNDRGRQTLDLVVPVDTVAELVRVIGVVAVRAIEDVQVTLTGRGMEPHVLPSGQRLSVERGPVVPVPESRSNAEMPTPSPGEHLWCMFAMYRITNPEHAQDPAVKKYLDLENLLTIDGPGCWVCEQVWSAAIAGEPCPGEPAR